MAPSRPPTLIFFSRTFLKIGEFSIGGERADLENIVCPPLNAIGEFDDVVYPASGLPLIDFVGSEKKPI